MTFAGCSKNDEQSLKVESEIKEKLSEEAKMQNDNITNNPDKTTDKDNISREAEISVDDGEGNRKAVTETYHLSIPDSFTRVDHNDHIYIYDSKGNSLNVSNQSTEIEVDEFSEGNYHKLISSSYENVEFQKLEHITIDKMKAIYIEYTGSKKDKNYLNCRYYIENGENTILMDIQAIDEANYKKLKSIAEEIKF